MREEDIPYDVPEKMLVIDEEVDADALQYELEHGYPPYCPKCEYDKIAVVKHDGRTKWSCPNCGKSNHD